jgi:hypothetical protein
MNSGLSLAAVRFGKRCQLFKEIGRQVLHGQFMGAVDEQSFDRSTGGQTADWRCRWHRPGRYRSGKMIFSPDGVVEHLLAVLYVFLPG